MPDEISVIRINQDKLKVFKLSNTSCPDIVEIGHLGFILIFLAIFSIWIMSYEVNGG